MVALDEIREEKQKRGELAFPVDTMHGGIRAAVMGTFVGAGFVGFVGGIVLLPNAILLAGITGLVAATGGAYGIERVLKERWPSGRELIANAERIAISKHGKLEAVVDCQKHVNVLAWQFKIKKDSPRAKKGSYLVALALEQDENYVIVYSAAKAEDFQDMPLSSSFTKLERKKEKDTDNQKSKSITTMREAGEQRRLQMAEFVRGMDGGDIDYEQFCDYIQFLQANYPQWMIS
jgi:hypothetical protein